MILAQLIVQNGADPASGSFGHSLLVFAFVQFCIMQHFESTNLAAMGKLSPSLQIRSDKLPNYQRSQWNVVLCGIKQTRSFERLWPFTLQNAISELAYHLKVSGMFLNSLLKVLFGEFVANSELFAYGDNVQIPAEDHFAPTVDV
jgi:hypothetical protein